MMDRPDGPEMPEFEMHVSVPHLEDEYYELVSHTRVSDKGAAP
jgi:hypothetical protein